MASLKRQRSAVSPGARRDLTSGHKIHVDGSEDVAAGAEGMDLRDESGPTKDQTAEQEEVEDSVLDDMHRLEDSFVGFSKKYRLINRIGEGRRIESTQHPFRSSTC